MPRFEPFRAVRYALSPNADPTGPADASDAIESTVELADLVAPPYDVQSDEQTHALAARHPHNVVHVDVPMVLSSGRSVDREGSDPYADAAVTLRRWLSDGVLIADAEPSLTIYRTRFTDSTGVARELVGVLGALEVVDEGAGGVLPHERTTPKASTDRLDLTRATQTNLSPVWGLALARGLTDALREPGEPMGRVVDGAGDSQVEHVVERVTDPERITVIRAAIEGDDVLIADGHHRYGVARTYRDELRRSGAGPESAAELTLAYVGELIPDQLSIAAIHRLYNGIGYADLRKALSAYFEISAAPTPSPAILAELETRGALVLLGPGSAEWLDPKPGVFEEIRALDGAWLEHALAGIPASVTYQHGVPEVLAAVESGAADAAVLIRPVSIGEIERTAREGLLMPPKSTFFTPKLLTGLVIRDLQD